MRTKSLALCLMVLGATALPALESTSLDMPVEEAVERRPSVLKPLHVFNMRGRRDPFVDVSVWRSAGSGVFSISGLEYKGVIEVDGVVTALFVSQTDRATYTLRGRRLYGAGEKAVPGVSGQLLENKEVRLRQGELSLNFSAIRSVKRKI